MKASDIILKILGTIICLPFAIAGGVIMGALTLALMPTWLPVIVIESIWEND